MNNNQIANLYPSPTATYDQVAQSSQLFWEKLKDFHFSFRTKFSVPTVGGKALDLHRLFIEVTTRGGFEKVIRDRKWKEVIMVFNFPTTITSASFVMRKYYLALLYHFEQVYYFHKQIPSVPENDPGSGSGSKVNDSGDSSESAVKTLLPVNVELEPGYSVNGTIDGKFDNGYLITVTMGSEKLKGVLYHVPNQNMSQSSHSSELRSRRKRKKSNKSGYNFFFAENYARLKPAYSGQENDISKRIGVLWNNLTEAERQVYQEKGTRDKERYEKEVLEYKSSSNVAGTQ